MQKIFLEGRLGRNAEVKESSNGNKFVRFTMAVNWRKGSSKDEKTTWYDVSSFNPAYTGKLVDYLKSGTAVIVVGDVEPELREGKDGKAYLNIAVKANSIEFPRINKKDESSEHNNGSAVKNNNEESSKVTSAPNKEIEEIPDDIISCMPDNNSPQSSTNEANSDDEDDLPF